MQVTFKVPVGETIARELLVALLNVGTEEAPKWSPVGKRVNDSSAEYDWSNDTSQDILGNTYTQKKKPVITQSFEPWDLSGGDEAQQKIYNLAVVEQNAQALSNQDMLIAHYYTTTSGSTAASFGERYMACSIDVTSLGGEGGGNIAMPISVTYGGERIIGSVTNSGGSVTFTPEASAASVEEVGV